VLKKILLLFCIQLSLGLSSNNLITYKKHSFYSSEKHPNQNIANKLNDSLFVKKYKNLLKTYKNGKYANVLKESFPLYENSKKYNNDKHNYLLSTLIARVYNKTKNYKKSLNYFNISIEYLDRNIARFDSNGVLNDSIDIELNKNYLLIGGLHQKIYRNELGLKKLELSEKHKDSAISYYKKIENAIILNDKIEKYKAISYYNLSGIYQKDSLYNKATKYAEKAIKIHKKNNDKINLSSSLNNLGSIYISFNKYLKAKNTYIQAINLVESNNSQKAVKNKAKLYYNLAWAMRNLKDYKAYDFQELSYEIEDDLRDTEIRRIIEEVTVKHKENLEQQKVDLVTEQRKLIEAKDDKTTLLFGALSLLVILISGVVVYNYKLRQKNLGLKLSENSLIQQQSIEKLKSDSQIKILNATIDGKESERKEIAEILHDNVSALLSSANMHLSATKKQLDGNTPVEIDKTQAIILEASQKVRDLSHNLISSILLKFGLEYALKDVAKKYSNSQLKFEVSAQDINRYNQEFEIKIFNIIQELTNNILKHSKASFAKITIKQEKNQLTVLVNDDGVGFSTSSSSFNNGIGLNQIEARIVMMNGKLSIDSEENKGTRVSIIIPVQHKKPFKLSSVS
jgi:signal transduction histidine kinase